MQARTKHSRLITSQYDNTYRDQRRDSDMPRSWSWHPGKQKRRKKQPSDFKGSFIPVVAGS
jgi:hypothetical protein